MTSSDLQRRAADRAVLVAAAREHSAAVAQHLEKVARRLREHGGAAGSAAAHGMVLPPLATALADLSRLLLADTSDEAVLATVLALTVSGIEGCDGASVSLLRDGRIETASATGDDVARSDRRQYARRAGPCYHAAMTGRTTRAEMVDDGEGGVWANVVSAPLLTGVGAIGALNVYSRTARALRETGPTVAELLADHAARALTKARTIRSQQALATSLQASLLPAQLPHVPGVRLAARYRPASTGINVGGDWYDVLPLPGGRVVLVIGDVAGHGLQAAMTMAQLRTAVRAYAVEGHDPAEVLRLVDAFLQRIEPEGYATCVVVTLNAATGALRWANAGHPDPLVVLPSGSGRGLTGLAHVPALGVPRPPGAVTRHGSDVLPPGSRLLLYTDGLVERRTEPLEVGLERLARSTATADGYTDPLESWCDEVVAAQLAGAEVVDDVAVLAVEFAGHPSRLADARPVPRVTG